VVLSRKLDQNMPKMRIFEKKSCKIAASSGLRISVVGLRRVEAPPTDSCNLIFVYCLSSAYSIERTLLLQKITEVTHC